MTNNVNALRTEVVVEEAIEANEVQLLHQAEEHLMGALQQLNVNEEQALKGKTASLELFSTLANNMVGRLAQASVEIESAVTLLRNSFGDEERLSQVARDAGEKARRNKAVFLTSVETKAMNLAKAHKATLEALIKRLEQVRAAIDSEIKNTPREAFGKKYYNFERIRKNSITDLSSVTEKISDYVRGLSKLFKILNMAEGKRPFWKFW